MLSGNRTHKTPAAQIAANVALGQFLKACSITLRFTDKLALRRSGSLLARARYLRSLCRQAMHTRFRAWHATGARDRAYSAIRVYINRTA